jgi:hypothetical protein
MGVAAVMLALLGLVVVPGLVWHRAWLSERNFSPLTAVVIALAALTVLSSSAAALLGYRLGLMLVLNGSLLLAGLVVWWSRRGRERVQPWTVWWSGLRLNLADALYFTFIVAAFLAPAFLLVVPFDTDAQGFGYLALTTRLGGTIDTLAPFYPGVRYLYSPGFFVLTAYLSDLLGVPVHQAMLGIGHAAAALVALLAYDLGKTLESKRLGLLMGLTVTVGAGLLTTVMDSAYTSVLAALFVELFLIMLWRAMERNQTLDVALAGLALAAVPLSHPDTTITLLIAYLPFYASAWLSHEMTWHRFRLLGLLIPALGLALTLPWLAKVWPLFFEAHIKSPFSAKPAHWSQLVLFNGALVPGLALVGAGLAARRRRLVDVLMLTWSLSVIDFGLFGLAGRVGALVGVDIMRYVYPYSIAWHGPMIPFGYLAALALDDFARHAQRLMALNWRRVRAGLALAGLILLVGGIAANRPLLRWSKSWLAIFGGFASEADVAALRWLDENSPEDSLLMNYPVYVEGHWAPVISERNSVSFRDQHFFSQRPAILEMQIERENPVTEIYHDLASPEAEAWLREQGADYVFVPQVIGDPASWAGLQRWKPPRTQPFESRPEDAAYLELVYERDGAQIYRVVGNE